MGIISEVGSGVTLLKKGDRVVLPFNVADGRCLNCEEGNTAFCTGVNPGFAGGGMHPPTSLSLPLNKSNVVSLWICRNGPLRWRSGMKNLPKFYCRLHSQYDADTNFGW